MDFWWDQYDHNSNIRYWLLTFQATILNTNISKFELHDWICFSSLGLNRYIIQDLSNQLLILYIDQTHGIWDNIMTESCQIVNKNSKLLDLINHLVDRRFPWGDQTQVSLFTWWLCNAPETTDSVEISPSNKWTSNSLSSLE